MTDVSCAEARDAAAEFALGILPHDERSAVAAHILRCAECRLEVEDLNRIGAELLDLIPDAEPPLGFERRVLAIAQPGRRRSRRLMAVIGAAAAAAAAVVGLVVSQGTSHRDHSVTARLVSDGHVIGSVYSEGKPAWISMMVRQAGVSGRVTCDLIENNGASVKLGNFDLVNGSASWAAPEPAGMGHIVGVRLLSANGGVLATATF